jgi:uncharacterized protein
MAKLVKLGMFMPKRVVASACRCLAFILLALLWAGRLPAADVNSLGEPTGYVNDFAHVLSPEDKDKLERYCTEVDRQLGVQFALVTVDTIGDTPIRDFSLEVGRKWGVGAKKDNQGLVLVLAVKDRKSDIGTGRGIDPYITDGFAGDTLRGMRPYLRQNDYGSALLLSVQSLAQRLAEGKNLPFTPPSNIPVRQPRRDDSDRQGIPPLLLILGVFFLLWLLGRGGRRGGGGGYRGGGGGGSFVTGMILGNMLGGGRGGSGGNWGGGGFGGGSGGGGGFGGFGGGDFGGGGASSDW